MHAHSLKVGFIFHYSVEERLMTRHYASTNTGIPHHIGMSFFVRVKRSNQTMFISSEPTDTFIKLKTKISEIGRVDPYAIKLFAQDKVRRRWGGEIGGGGRRKGASVMVWRGG
jgi:hypothetical protein